MMFLGQFNVNFWVGGYLATHMANLGMKKEYFGYIITIQGFIYLGSCFLFSMICSNVPRRFMFIIALVGYGIVNLFIGPSKILGVKDSYEIISAAIFLQGMLNYFSLIPVVPEIIDRLKVKLQTREG